MLGLRTRGKLAKRLRKGSQLIGDIPFAEVRAWIGGALSFWGERGVDQRFGGFHEELSAQGDPTSIAFKRVRVMCRQTYVFTHAALRGWAPGAALSTLGYEYLISKARTADGGWAKVLSREGDIIDATPDLYDISFVLYALAWRYRLTSEPKTLGLAHQALDYLLTHMKHPVEGYWHRVPPAGFSLQNPHMHLLEALLAAFEASGDERFWIEAGRVVDLFKRRLFDGRSLAERFDEGWARSCEQALEPGHHFEWAWILLQYQRLGGGNLTHEARALVAFGEKHGVHKSTQAVFDAVNEAGAPVRASSRAWTNTERIKAWLGLFEVTGCDPSAAVAASTRLLVDRYFAALPAGLWVDQFDAHGSPVAAPVPASIMYHLHLAFAELLRLEPGLTR